MVVQCTIDVTAEDYYSCDLTKRIPVRVSIITINGDTGFGIVEPTDGKEQSIQEYVNGLALSPSTRRVDVTFKSPVGYWTEVVHRLGGPSIYDTVLQSGCMTQLPIVIQQGIQTHKVLAPSRSALRDLLQTLRSRFTKVSVKRLKSTDLGATSIALTEKQRDAFLLAIGRGYYSIPRGAKLEDLCKELGIKRVAMQERLRRAEIQILNSYAEELLGSSELSGSVYK
jgi:predicted DNA binding protein